MTLRLRLGHGSPTPLAVHRKISLVLTLIAWLFATGSHWDFVQVFAWAKMFSENVQVMPVRRALERTFSPEGRCALCCAVSAAKQQEENPGRVPSGDRGKGKILLLFQPVPAVVVEAPDYTPWNQHDQAALSAPRPAPPSPPPRV
jgi:hypothetical protein